MDNTKFYYYCNDETTIQQAIDEYLKLKKANKDLTFVIIADKDFIMDSSFSQNLKKTLSYLDANNIKPHSIEFSIDSDDKKYSNSEWTKIKNLATTLEKKGIKFGLEDMTKTWSIKEVETANKKISTTADDIKKLNLSPYEKIMMAYLKVTSRKYVYEDETDHYSESRSVYGVLNSEKIVCVGFSELFEAIIKEVGDENIQIYQNNVACAPDGKVISGHHRNMIIHVTDEKYGIDGFYYIDPTWDCGHQDKYVPTISFFMIPLSDIDKIKDQIRGDWCNLPRQNKRAKSPKLKMAKVKQTNFKVYGKKDKQNVSFTADGFKLTKEFLEKSIALYPKLGEAIKESVISNSYLYMLDNVENEKKEEEYYTKVLDILSSSSLDFVSQDDYNNFKYIVAKGVRNGDTKSITDWLLEREISEEKTIVPQEIIDKIIDDNTSKLPYELENETKAEMSYEAYMKSVDEMVESITDPTEKEKARKVQVDYYPYETYIEDKKIALASIRTDIEEQEKKHAKFKNVMAEVLRENPDLIKNFTHLDNNSQYFLYSTIIYASEDEDAVESAKQFLERQKYLSMKEFINNKLASTRKYKESDLQRLKELESMSAIDCIPHFLESCEHYGVSPEIDKWLKSQSKPIELYKTANALKVILSKSYESATDQEIKTFIQQIFTCTRDSNLEAYEETAINALSQPKKQKDSQEQLPT